MSPALAGGFLTTVPPGKSAIYFLSEGSVASVTTWTSPFRSRDPFVQDRCSHLLDLTVSSANGLDLTLPTPVVLKVWSGGQQQQPWELVRNLSSWASLHTCWMRNSGGGAQHSVL